MDRRLTQGTLKSILNYNPSTGIFTNKIWRGGKATAGSQAGHLKSDGYIVIKVDGFGHRAHRLAWLYVYGYIPETEVDHIDRKRSNNRISNLREISRTCNIRNMGLPVTNKTGIKGVIYNKRCQKWRAYISINKKSIHLGYFTDFSKAVKARWEAEKKYNFSNCCMDSSAYQYLRSNNHLRKEK